MNISAVPNRTVNTELDELTPLVMIKPQGNQPQPDAVSTQEPKTAAPRATAEKPTDGVREETKPAPTHADIERMAEARALENPEYQELLAKLAQCQGLEEKFLQIDSIGLFSGDQAIVAYDLAVLINDVNQPNKAAREAAKFLNDNKWIWAEIAGSDGRAGLQDVKDLLARLKSRRDEIKNQARTDVRAELGVPTQAQVSGTPAQGASGQRQQPAATTPGVDIPRPPPSARPGMEGAMDNLANVGDWLSQQMMALAEKAAAEPEKATLYQQQIAMLQNQYQAITNMMNQLTQTMSNLSKMWSDVAMNSIRNIK